MSEYKSLATVIREMNAPKDPAMDAPAVPGKTSDKLMLDPRYGFGISRRLRSQVQSKIIDNA